MADKIYHKKTTYYVVAMVINIWKNMATFYFRIWLSRLRALHVILASQIEETIHSQIKMQSQLRLVMKPNIYEGVGCLWESNMIYISCILEFYFLPLGLIFLKLLYIFYFNETSCRWWNQYIGNNHYNPCLIMNRKFAILIITLMTHKEGKL